MNETKEDQKTSEVISTEEPQVFGTIQKSDDTLIMVCLNNYKGYSYIDVRQWWKPYNEENYKPTKHGITIPIDDTLTFLDETIAALIKAKEQLSQD
jgi:hypothetical protein